MRTIAKTLSASLAWLLLTGFSIVVNPETADISIERTETELQLLKADPYYFLCNPCKSPLYFRKGQNRRDFAEYGDRFRSGHFYVELSGPVDTTITLFGAEGYKTERGFLIVIKQDKEHITISNLENFPANEWREVPPREGWNGAYKAYYQPYERFKENVASALWGNWWREQLPELDRK